MMIGGLSASKFLLGASVPVVRWSMPWPPVSSLAQSQELCTRIWSGFDEYDIHGCLQRSDTESSLLSSYLPNADIYGSSNTSSKKSLSAKIEARACRNWLGPSSQERHCLILLPQLVPGAGAWPLALPDSLDSHIPSPLFQVSLCRRLGMPIWYQDTHTARSGKRHLEMHSGWYHLP